MMKNLPDILQVRSKGKILNWIMLTCILSLSFGMLHAQTRDRKWNIGLMGGFSVYAGDLGNSMTNFTYDVFRQNPTAGLNISRYLGKSFDISVNSSIGSWGYYTGGKTVFKGTMMHANLNLKYKLNNGYMLSEDSRVSPYIFGGMGISNYTGVRINEGYDNPIVGGLGISLRMSPTISLNYQATFGYMMTAHNNPQDFPNTAPTGTDQFMLHMFGIGFNLGAGKDADKDGVPDSKDKCAETPENVPVDKLGCPLDKDLDGVMDYEDKCKDLAGTAQTQGCPDADKDGVADTDDLCPNEAGLPSNNGCPDADGDGVIDSKDKCPNVAGTVVLEGCPDKDNDGVRDGDDYCPDVKGLTQFNGCPDTDNDGIEDAKDMCPNVSGTLKTNGCPDTDNDGVHDGIDRCKDIYGSAEHGGCPDTDKDGVYDDIDLCPTIPGVATNFGCPEIKKEVKQLFQKALQGIQFETGKAVIKPVSFPILNAIVNVMKTNPTYKLLIGGHTDNVGEDEMNMTLSQDRATAVSNYLISHGVDPLRLNATGYGETKPVDTNDSVNGRTRNRRVEFKVEFLQ